jgi:hypothetical protein
MANEAKRTLWTSVYSDRSGIERVDATSSLSTEAVEKIRSAFVKKSTDERIQTYSSQPSSEELSLARVFG